MRFFRGILRFLHDNMWATKNDLSDARTFNAILSAARQNPAHAQYFIIGDDTFVCKMFHGPSMFRGTLDKQEGAS